MRLRADLIALWNCVYSKWRSRKWFEPLCRLYKSFTNVFAAGRRAGWTAHVLEQEQTGCLIRPQSRYIGQRAGSF